MLLQGRWAHWSQIRGILVTTYSQISRSGVRSPRQIHLPTGPAASINKHFGAHKSWKLNGGRSGDFLERRSWILSSSPQHRSSHRCCTTGQDVVRNVAPRTQIQAPQEPGPGLGWLKLLAMYSGLCFQAGGGKVIWFYLCLELIHLIFPSIWHYGWRINRESRWHITSLCENISCEGKERDWTLLYRCEIWLATSVVAPCDSLNKHRLRLSSFGTSECVINPKDVLLCPEQILLFYVHFYRLTVVLSREQCLTVCYLIQITETFLLLQELFDRNLNEWSMINERSQKNTWL